MFSTCRDLLKTHYIVCIGLSVRSAAVTSVGRLALYCWYSNNRNASACIQMCLSHNSLDPNANFMCFHINGRYFKTSFNWNAAHFHRKSRLH